jgi:hypothetical protein
VVPEIGAVIILQSAQANVVFGEFILQPAQIESNAGSGRYPTLAIARATGEPERIVRKLLLITHNTFL